MQNSLYSIWTITLTACDEAQTTALAHRMQSAMRPADVVLLSGPIGAGKSYFARALIQGLLADFDVIEDIPSPTFTLVQTYQAGELEIWHSDLYRLSNLSEIDELGLTDAFETALCLVEWPDRLGRATPQSALSMSFQINENPDLRDIIISAADPKWDWLKPVLKGCKLAKPGA